MKHTFNSMRTLIGTLVTIGSLAGGANGAVVLTFDETSSLSRWNGGVLADGFSLPALTSTAGQATQYNLGGTAYSGSNALYNFNTRIGTIVRDAAFDFEGAWFNSNVYGNITNTTFVLSALDQFGVVVQSESRTVSSTWTYLQYDWNNIWGLSFDPTSPDTENMAMDNLTYNAVPEPSSALLIGLGALGFVARRKRTK